MGDPDDLENTGFNSQLLAKLKVADSLLVCGDPHLNQYCPTVQSLLANHSNTQNIKFVIDDTIHHQYNGEEKEAGGGEEKKGEKGEKEGQGKGKGQEKEEGGG